ncbi:hypothetical protein CHARACLAT_027846 [Characodon lateralis]|uniref:Uncharacterized protein n=1 Tax=Characodon lateralis TaxID=208331 RepID=A0ABU7E473_9TELE|nr:hypothetical protein [Characodon lateralis]
MFLQCYRFFSGCHNAATKLLSALWSNPKPHCDSPIEVGSGTGTFRLLGRVLVRRWGVIAGLWCRSLESGQVSLGEAEVMESNSCQQSLTGNLGNRGSPFLLEESLDFRVDPGLDFGETPYLYEGTSIAHTEVNVVHDAVFDAVNALPMWSAALFPHIEIERQ